MKENAVYRMYNLSSSTAPINKGTTNNEQQITQKIFKFQILFSGHEYNS